jgi:hypothetical protein
MDPELANLSKQALLDLYNNLVQAKSFVISQAPDFCQQLVARALAINAFVMFLCIIGIGVSIYLFCIGRKQQPKLGEDPSGYFVSSVGFIVCSVAFFVYSATEFISCYMAPKVYIVEQLSKMLK